MFGNKIVFKVYEQKQIKRYSKLSLLKQKIKTASQIHFNFVENL